MMNEQGFAATARVGKGLQSINIPPEALCERCIYSREGHHPAASPHGIPPRTSASKLQDGPVLR